MELFDPSKITTWISLSAAGLLLLIFIAKLVINSEPIKKVTKKNTYNLLKSTINKTFYIVIIIVILAGSITIFDKYINNKMRKVAEEVQQSQHLIQEWSILEESDKQSAINSLRLSAYKFHTYEGYFMYATMLSKNDNLSEARIAYNDALKIKKTKEAFLDLSIVEKDLGLIDDALINLENAEKTDGYLLNNKVINAKIYFNFSSIYLNKYEENKLDKYLSIAENFLEKSKYLSNVNSNLQSSLYGLKARLYESKKEYEKSARYYLKSVTIRSKYLFGSNEFIKLELLGIIYLICC